MIYTMIKSGFQPSVLYDTFLPKAYAIGLKYNGLSVLQKQIFTNKIRSRKEYIQRGKAPYYFSPICSEAERWGQYQVYYQQQRGKAPYYFSPMCSEAERWGQCRVYHQYLRGKAPHYFSPMCGEAERWEQCRIHYQYLRGKAPYYFSPMCSEAERWGQCRVRNSGGLKA